MSAISWLLPRRVFSPRSGGGVALGAQEGAVVLHIEHSLCGVHNPPDHHSADDDGIAPLIIDGLFLIVQRHGFQGDLLVPAEGDAGVAVDGGHGGGGSSGIDPLTEGIDPEVAVLLQGAVILAEQGEHQCLVGVQDLQPGHEEQIQQKHQGPQYNQGHSQGHIGGPKKNGSADGHGNAAKEQHQNQCQHGKAVFKLGGFFLVAVDDFFIFLHTVQLLFKLSV